MEARLEERLLKYLRDLGHDVWSMDVWHSNGDKCPLPVGFSDIYGMNIEDGKAIFIEVKTPRGRVEREQKDFIEEMYQKGAYAGVACNESDIDDILNGGLGNIEKLIRYRGYTLE